jgi:hypothetical protein
MKREGFKEKERGRREEGVDFQPDGSIIQGRSGLTGEPRSSVSNIATVCVHMVKTDSKTSPMGKMTGTKSLMC